MPLIEYIAYAAMVVGFGGSVTVIRRRFPDLAAASKRQRPGSVSLSRLTKDAIVRLQPADKDIERIAQRLLSRIRVLLLRLERRVEGALSALRQRTKEKQERQVDHEYWRELRKDKRGEE